MISQSRTDSAGRRAAPQLWVGLALFCLYLMLVSIRPAGVFWSLDEGGKLLYIQNVLATGDPAAPLDYPGRLLDPELRYLPLYFWAQSGTQIYSWWPVAFPLLSLPFYAMFGWIGLYLLPALGGAACAVLSGRITGKLGVSPRAGAVAAVIVGLATPVLFYSTMFWEHTLSVAALLLAVWATMQARQRIHPGWPVLAGIAGSLAGFLRTEQLFGTAALVLVLLAWHWRRGLIMAFAVAVTSGAWLAFNRWFMGAFVSRQWGEGSAQLTTVLFPGLQEAGSLYVPYLLFSAPKIIAYDLGTALLGIGTAIALLCVLLPFVLRLWWLLVFCYLGLAALGTWVLLQPEGYRSVHGIVIVAPHIVLFPWVLRGLRRGDQHLWLVACLLLPAASILGAFVLRSWLAAGGQQWGPRYLLALYPLLTMAAVVGLQQVRTQASPHLWTGLAASAIVLVAVGVGFEVRGQQAAWTTTENYRLTRAALQADTTTPRLTDCTWLPMVIPELYWRGDFFARHDRSEDLDTWQRYIGRQGSKPGQFWEIDMCLDEPLDRIGALRQDNPSGVKIEALP